MPDPLERLAAKLEHRGYEHAVAAAMAKAAAERSFAGAKACALDVRFEGTISRSRQLHDALDRLRLEIDEVVDAGDSVVALGRMRVHGKRSDITVEQQMALLCRLQNGQIVALRTYIRPAEALKAARLRK